jgi:TonB family protein
MSRKVQITLYLLGFSLLLEYLCDFELLLMNRLLFLVLIAFSNAIYGQGECQISYVSDHYVSNNTADVVSVWVNNRNQKRVPFQAPEKFEILPGARIKVCDLEWAGEFRDPTQWYIFKVAPVGLTRLCDSSNWKFERLSETEGEYSLTLAPTEFEPCHELNDELYFQEQELPVEEEIIYDYSESEAQFPGGREALALWVHNNQQYPLEARKQEVSGVVYIQFVVEKNGELTNLNILRSPHELLSQEAMRLMEMMPNWEPGRFKDKIVRVRLILPIKFQL